MQGPWLLQGQTAGIVCRVDLATTFSFRTPRDPDNASHLTPCPFSRLALVAALRAAAQLSAWNRGCQTANARVLADKSHTACQQQPAASPCMAAVTPLKPQGWS